MVSGGIEYRLKGEELDDDVCYLRGTTLPACVPTTYTVPVHRTTPLPVPPTHHQHHHHHHHHHTMRDPFRALAPKPLEALSVPLARALNLPALPLHAHEVLFAITFYAFLAQVVSPAVSRRVVPSRYALMDRRSRISWNVHVVSFVQSCVVNALSLYIICCDEERQSWRGADAWELRIWGYTGLIGLTQSLALGYFLWDLYMCVRHVHIFGWGMVAHAIASSAMFTLGFVRFFFSLATTYLTYLPTCNVTYARVYSLTDNVGSDHSFISTALSFCSMSCLLPSSTSTGSATSSVSRVLSIRLSMEAFSSSPSSPVVSCGEHMARGECPRTSIEPSSQIATSPLTPRARKLPTRCAKSALWAL